MSKRMFVALFFALVTISSVFGMHEQETRELEAQEVEECENGEVYLECGSECPEACYNLGQPRACGLRCKTGCFCSEGLIRNPDGDCVAPGDCPDILY
ncbi:Hypothetical predicted protein [Cloeon dipterum]|uniref:TIL domain-containing protein n=1 Tax=Cloeon dipterum TaxID=197152 RepID=A0A8S1CWR0_9INSE|nr:Hypothetical predicted protein [Cloeon dipterum]